uniref:Putative serine/threonine-protein phosphatase 1 regulatory subunit 10-like isoform x1 n=1 Tax=Tabanus bromius TaxID=304241 RepID=A0A0K8TS52_TABBR
MPRIDPVKLLSCLKVLLAPNGGIRSANEVKRIAELMLKYSKKLVSKCIYIQILKCTNTDLLEKFMGAGGWGLTHIWLSDGIRTMNWPLVQEILELLLLCPVDVQRLRSNTAPKLVKSLCKDGGNEGVRILATKLVEQWLKIVKGETMATTRNIQNASGAPSLQNDMTDHQIGAPQANAVNTILIENHANSHASEASKEQDPLAIAPHNADESVMRKASSINLQSPNASGDSALVYKIVIKDGKQVLAKVDPPTTAADAGKEKVESDSKHSESKRVDSPQPDSPGAKDKEKDDDSKESKESDREKRDKEKSRDKDHKSSSSSHRKSSSSSSSKVSSSKSSGGGSSSSSSKSKHHSSSSSSRRSSKDGSSSSSKSKDRDKEREKDKDRSYDKERDKDKKSSSSKSSSSSSSSSKSKDRDREKDKEKHRSSKDKDRDHKEKDSERSREDKHKDKYKSDSQSSDSSEKSSKKPKEDSGSSPSHKPQLTSIQIPSKKASMSIEVRRDVENRPKTVKTYNSQFRSHGLAEEAPPPPSRKGLKKPITQSTPGTTIMSNIQLKRPSPPPEPSSPPPAAPSTPPVAEKESPVPEKKMKIDLAPPAERAEKPGGIKLIAPKPKRKILLNISLIQFSFFSFQIRYSNRTLNWIFDLG